MENVKGLASHILPLTHQRGFEQVIRVSNNCFASVLATRSLGAIGDTNGQPTKEKQANHDRPWQTTLFLTFSWNGSLIHRKNRSKESDTAPHSMLTVGEWLSNTQTERAVGTQQRLALRILQPSRPALSRKALAAVGAKHHSAITANSTPCGRGALAMGNDLAAPTAASALRLRGLRFVHTNP